MQRRMKEFTMTETAIEELLCRGTLAHIGTINDDGSPYVLPVNYIYFEGNIYIHGLKVGTKVDNIKRDNRVCIEVCEFNKVMKENLEVLCNIDVDYESVVVMGTAAEIVDVEKKKELFTKFFAKYAPDYKDLSFPEARVKGTLILEITPSNINGKYHR